jgi:hypothetical protein
MEFYSDKGTDCVKKFIWNILNVINQNPLKVVLIYIGLMDIKYKY